MSETIYLETPVTATALGFHAGEKFMFVGMDLAPVDTLETGITVIDREKAMVRMDKLYSDESILTFLANLAPSQNLVLAIDMPKNLSVPGRWRQEELKLHPLRLNRPDTEIHDRYAARARQLYKTLETSGIFVCLYFVPMAKMAYGLTVPYRSRSPHGCRALQSAIGETLQLGNMPANLAPSSVLDAMIGSYAAWSLYKGVDGEHYRLFKDDTGYTYMTPLSPLVRASVKRKRRYTRNRF